MSAADVVIIDYNMGNLWSVASAIDFLGFKPQITDNLHEIASAKILILPGVGSYRRAMETIKNKSFDKAISEALNCPSSKLLGICLGMQLLGASNTEDGETQGLGFVTNHVKRFSSTPESPLKIPHVGFSEVAHNSDTILFRGIGTNSDFYFVHSYFMEPSGVNSGIATCTYGSNFVAAFEHGQISGTQFHPEKSQQNGLKLLENFLNR